MIRLFFFFNDTATTEIYTLSLHDALPISGQVLREWDDTPEGFGRIAATTAKQTILQRLRDVEDEQLLGEFRGREGDIVAGAVQQSADPRMVHVDIGGGGGRAAPPAHAPCESFAHV